MNLSVCTGECDCGREIQGVVPWNINIKRQGAYIRCSECSNIVNATVSGDFRTDK